MSETIEFLSYRKPTLKDGHYRITVCQKLDIPDHTGESQQNQCVALPEVVRTFSVLGERFRLDPQLITTMFPPANGRGDFADVLPHVVLKRGALPWERSGDGNDSPWLALLLFDKDDPPPSPETIPLSELRERVSFYRTHQEYGEKEDERVTVIEVPWKLFKQVRPKSAEALQLLTHVRKPDGGEEMAVVVGNRLPKPGSVSVAYLVSVEGRFTNADLLADTAPEDEKVCLVVLKSWNFTCRAKHGNFKQLLESLDGRDEAVLSLPTPPADPGDAAAQEGQARLRAGYAPLPHFWRNGQRTVSWYHGPLVPAEAPLFDMPEGIITADALLRYNEEYGMYDVSYAAAWELGRLLLLQNKRVSVALTGWKRDHIAWAKQAAKEIEHLPFQPVQRELDLPQVVQAWFNDLALLKGLPFNYLVPDERMLPKESIRFFWVDPGWLHTLLDGAFSIGRASGNGQKWEAALPPYEAPVEEKMTGFLLRSAVVSGWPELVVRGRAKADGSAIQPDRCEPLSPNVLLCLFKQEIDQVIISQKPEVIHFGFEPEDGGYSKALRYLAGDQAGAPLDGDPLSISMAQVQDNGSQANNGQETKFVIDSNRVVDVDGLSKAIRNKLLAGQLADSGKLSAAEFAMTMVEGVDQVSFSRGDKKVEPVKPEPGEELIQDPDLVNDRHREATFDELVAAYRELDRPEQARLVERLMWLELGYTADETEVQGLIERGDEMMELLMAQRHDNPELVKQLLARSIKKLPTESKTSPGTMPVDKKPKPITGAPAPLASGQIFLRHTVGETQSTHHHEGVLWHSPDIIPRAYAYGSADDPENEAIPDSLVDEWDTDFGTDLQAGRRNYIYLRGENTGPAQAARIRLYVTKASVITKPADWNLLALENGQTENETQAPANGRFVWEQPFVWEPVQLGPNDHYCLLAWLDTDQSEFELDHRALQDKMTAKAAGLNEFIQFVGAHEDLAWRNVKVVDQVSYVSTVLDNENVPEDGHYMVLVAVDGLAYQETTVAVYSTLEAWNVPDKGSIINRLKEGDPGQLLDRITEMQWRGQEPSYKPDPSTQSQNRNPWFTAPFAQDMGFQAPRTQYAFVTPIQTVPRSIIFDLGFYAEFGRQARGKLSLQLYRVFLPFEGDVHAGAVPIDRLPELVQRAQLERQLKNEFNVTDLSAVRFLRLSVATNVVIQAG